LAESRIPLSGPRGERQVIVAEKTAFGPLAKIFAATPVSTWRDYLVVHYLHTFAAYLRREHRIVSERVNRTSSSDRNSPGGISILLRLAP
jgi:predicted metalloendopeptidase